MSTRRRALFAPAILSTAAVFTTIAGCGGEGGDGSLSPGTSGNGSVSIALTDAPVDFASTVMVEFTGIELTPQTGNRITVNINPARAVDLLKLQDGVTLTLLQNQSVPAGNYTRVRFIVNASGSDNHSYVDLITGERYPLVMPTGGDAGLALDRTFGVAKDGRVDLTVDFDLRKSIVSTVSLDGNYAFKPLLRVVDGTQAGTISGTVGPNLVGGVCEPYVYVFSGANVVPDDIDLASDIDPLVSVPVKLNTSSGVYTYRASFLEAGNYTVSFTCTNLKQDDPELEDSMTFSRTLQATVAAGKTATVDFSN
jgi:hypothetical protein